MSSYYRSPTDAALQKLATITQESVRLSEVRKSDGTVKHKCFLSYYSADAQEVLGFVERFGDYFIPHSIGVSNSDGAIIDSNDVDYVMDTIRDKHLANTTVTIVLIGSCTWSRKYVDWEVYSTLRRDKINRLSGLLAVQLPSMSGGKPTLPLRVSDNVGDGRYGRYIEYPAQGSWLQEWIEDAYNARTNRSNLINNSRSRRERNSDCS